MYVFSLYNCLYLVSVCCVFSTEYSVNKDYYKVSNQAKIVKSDNLLYYVVCNKDC